MRKITVLAQVQFTAYGKEDAKVLASGVIRQINKLVAMHGLRAEPEISEDASRLQVMDDEQVQRDDLN